MLDSSNHDFSTDPTNWCAFLPLLADICAACSLVGLFASVYLLATGPSDDDGTTLTGLAILGFVGFWAAGALVAILAYLSHQRLSRATLTWMIVGGILAFPYLILMALALYPAFAGVLI